MEVLRLIEEFENIVEECSRIPMTGKLIMNEDTVYNFIDKMRVLLPEAIQEAEWIMRERERLIGEAEREAETIIEAAKAKLQRLAGESEVVRLAKSQSEEIIDNSKQVAKEVTQGALSYADDVMMQLQAELEKTLQVVRASREELRGNQRERKE